jgi:eukaryotic-like serine/threonine-protein kinase
MTERPSRIGSYPIERELGRGGMGVVYLGRDVRLERLVAIKVLPDALAHDAERLARFEREARILASLRHVNIAGIYGLEESDGRRFLTLEYVEGDTLAQRVDRGALPIEEALDVCRQIAAGLEAAHEGGVIHRDLKPGNVKITPGGEVKVLDFGLAKGGAGNALSGSEANLSLSPTLAATATGVGIILGTAAYMSPEQARGRLVDRRTDIWAFGCVLYECLTGRQLFTGETVSDVLAKILERDPDWEALPPRLPSRARELLRRCLEKDSKRRLRDIGDARIQLEEALVDLKSEASAPPRERRAPATSPGSTRMLAIGAAMAALGAIAGVAGWSRFGPDSLLRHQAKKTFEGVAHVSITLPPDVRFDAMALLPHGKLLAGRGRPRSREGSGAEAVAMIYTRPLDSYDMKPLAGTEGVGLAFPSPDGRSVFFTAPVTRGPRRRGSRACRWTAVRPPSSWASTRMNGVRRSRCTTATSW